MIKNILYGTDLGLYAPYLMQHVMSLAAQHKAKVQAVHAVEPMGIFAESILSSYIPSDEVVELRKQGFGNVMDRIRHQVENAFADEFSEYKYDLALIKGIEVISGKPADVILDAAKRGTADLIVIGSCSQPSETPTLGSVANRVLSSSPIPVFLVPMVKLQNPQNLDLYSQ